MTENEIINRLHLHGETMTQDEAFFIMDALEEIQQYRALEQKLQSVYGEHDGLLEIIVNGLVNYENAPDRAIKAVLLTDDDVEKWEQYKAIGTVEGYKRAIEISKENFRVSMEYKAKVQAFEAIGTIEEFKALKENSEPKKQGNINDCDSHLRLSEAGFLCCGETNKAIRYPLISLRDLEYCPRCGQKLDWSE